MTFAQDERAALAEEMTHVGPDAPTLCGTWTARDLAAHLVVRERRLDSAPGILLPPLAGYTERIRAGVARRPFVDLVEDVRTGPPLWSPFKLVDAWANLAEMFVHHEDLRRAGEEWTRRPLADDLERRLWTLVSLLGRKSYRTSPVSVTLQAPAESNSSGRSVTVRKASGPGVVLVGQPSELLLHAFGRSQVEIEFRGAAEDIAAVQRCDRSV